MNKIKTLATDGKYLLPPKAQRAVNVEQWICENMSEFEVDILYSTYEYEMELHVLMQQFLQNSDNQIEIFDEAEIDFDFNIE